MQVTRLELRDFRNYEAAELALPRGARRGRGPNGAGKTNLLEAAYFGCTGASPRTSNERELVRRGATVARVVIETRDDEATHRIEAGFQPGEAKHLRVDGQRRPEPVDPRGAPARERVPARAAGAREGRSRRPAGPTSTSSSPPSGPPARARARRTHVRSLNATPCSAASAPGVSGPAALDAWDAELAREGIALMEDRAGAVEGLQGPFARLAEQLGLPGPAELRYRPRSGATDAAGLVAELAERRSADLERGFTAHGPHRDELLLALDGAPLRAYGSQGQQRTALLALLFAERELLAERRDRPPLMLLDDVMSELDSERRELLAELLRSGGQAIVTATEAEHVPSVEEDELVRVGAGALRGPVAA